MLQDKKIMPPLWLAYPEIDRYSIGWRMGYGESYKDRFFEWFDALSDEEKKEYEALFPEPLVWKGWWREEDTCELFTHEDYCIPLWRQEGEPRYSAEGLCRERDGGKERRIRLFFKNLPVGWEACGNGCFSQWQPQEFLALDRKYSCMEQFMMEQKAELFGDEAVRQQILEDTDPKRFKALGRKVKGFRQDIWDQVKYSVVLNGNWYKFSQNRTFREFLLSTGDDILAEASPYDAVWGIRLSEHAPDAQDPAKWRGQNLLGFALMEVRDELRRVNAHENLCDWRWDE